jgi:ribosome-binding protein aMBF1 (putative translation factor)
VQFEEPLGDMNPIVGVDPDQVGVERGVVDLGERQSVRARPVWVQSQEHKIVGACLADARRWANLTQQELAKRFGKPQSFVSDYERGQRRIDLILWSSWSSLERSKMTRKRFSARSAGSMAVST